MNKLGLALLIPAAVCLLIGLVHIWQSTAYVRRGYSKSADESINTAMGWMVFAVIFAVLLVLLGIK